MKVTAAQHVSATLTPEQSPKGHTGFQTLFYTQELLTPDEVRVIECRVQYNSAVERKVKWQSYRLSDRRHVISRVVPIPEADSSGRAGRYFSHSLICDVPAGPQFDASLLDLLRARNFFPSLDKVLAFDGMKTEHIPAVPLKIRDGAGVDTQDCQRDWSGEELNRLYILMSDPRLLTEQGQHVTLLGSEEQILSALRVAFALAPPAARKFCSFDTNPSHNVSPPCGDFWGHGAASAGNSDHVLDAPQRRVIIPASSPLLANGFSPDQISEPLRKALLARLGRSGEDDVLRRLVECPYADFIGELIYQTLLGEARLRPTPDDLEVFLPFGQSHSGLDLLLALMSGDDERRLRRLAVLSLSPYKELVGRLKARPDFNPWQALSPIFMPTWFELFRGEYRLDDLTAALTKVAEHGSEQDRNYVETLHEHLDPALREPLGRWLKASPLRFDRLQDALDSPAPDKEGSSRAGKSSFFLRRIFHPFGK